MIATRLNKGDQIGIVSPSNPVTKGDPKLDKGVSFLEEMGFNVVLGQYVYSTTLGYAASPQEKAEDINGMFADQSIKAIICTQGGYTGNACLPCLNWPVIKNNPKIFLGISDITVLLNAIYAQTGLVTFHGNDVMWGFGNDPAPYDIQEFVSMFVEAKIGLVKAHGERKTVRSGQAEGTLLGGNLNCFLKLAGTPYCPDFADAVLFVEALNIKPEECDFMFHQLKQIGIFEQVQGVIIGYIDGPQNDPEASTQMEDVLLTVTAEYDFPILKVNDFGHNCPNTTLPVGARVGIDANRQELEILEPCVRAEP
jgi:muramoyltetrapeptide carboxypeptidase